MRNPLTKESWVQLGPHVEKIKQLHMRELFKDKNRFDKYSMEAAGLFLDYSKNCITDETMGLLGQLAEEQGLPEMIDAMFWGEKINSTENRAVLHTALRNFSSNKVMVDGEDVMPEIQAVLHKMRQFSEAVRSGQWKGYTGKAMTDVVNIGIGGSDLGPKMVCHALLPYASHIRCHFVSNIDGSQITETLKSLNPETTLFCVASKTFTTLETLTNANTARKWLVEHLSDEKAVAQHFVAISTNTEKVQQFGIHPNQMFEFWDWVGGRYSVWSAIGLPIALTYGMDHFEAFLRGAYEMDQHFKTAPLIRNMPVILALLGIWYVNFFHTTTYAVLPYDFYLSYLPSYLQQLDMESNGKSVGRNAKSLHYHTGPVLWGGVGTDTQHSFHQLLHQGSEKVPVDFILPLSPHHALPHQHRLLVANCLAQSQALLQGKTQEEAFAELVSQGMPESTAKTLSCHKMMEGNRPSNTLLMDQLTPKNLGALIALYEHKVFVQGVLWNINSYDQWGVELGKQMAKSIDPDLQGQGRNQSYDASTQGLIRCFLKANNSTKK